MKSKDRSGSSVQVTREKGWQSKPKSMREWFKKRFISFFLFCNSHYGRTWGYFSFSFVKKLKCVFPNNVTIGEKNEAGNLHSYILFSSRICK